MAGGIFGLSRAGSRDFDLRLFRKKEEDIERRGSLPARRGVRVFPGRELESDFSAGGGLRGGVCGTGVCAGARVVRLCVVRGIWREFRGVLGADGGSNRNSVRNRQPEEAPPFTQRRMGHPAAWVER